MKKLRRMLRKNFPNNWANPRFQKEKIIIKIYNDESFGSTGYYFDNDGIEMCFSKERWNSNRIISFLFNRWKCRKNMWALTRDSGHNELNRAECGNGEKEMSKARASIEFRTVTY